MTNAQPDRASRLWLLVAVLGLVGLGVTTYLTANALSNSNVACTLSGCNTVLSSKWAKILGVPVSAWGMMNFAVILLASLHAFQTPVWNMRGRVVTAGIAFIGISFSIYLTALEMFVIHAWCQYCITSAVLVILVTILVVVIARREGPLWDAIKHPRDLLGE